MDWVLFDASGLRSTLRKPELAGKDGFICARVSIIFVKGLVMPQA
jgi:hypothetical protein